MKSSLPKVLHPVAGSPMISRVVNQARLAGAKEVRVVLGYGEALVRQVIEPLGAICFKQNEQRGTADAVRSARPENLEGPVLILNGDHPLVEVADIKRVCEDFFSAPKGISLVTATLKNPGSFGRIVRQDGDVKAIVEAKDASGDTLKIREINTGIYMLDAKLLNDFLPKISNENAQGEFYLTDIIRLAIEHRIAISPVNLGKHVAVGVNSQIDLARASKKAYMIKAEKLMAEGVVMIDPSTNYIDEQVSIGASTVIYPGVFIRGATRIGSFCVIEPNVFINTAVIEDSVHVLLGSHLEGCAIRSKASVGPYARIRPDTDIGVDAKVGNFVELKKVKFGAGAKASHLTYLGDAEIGENTNIGCGTITCNYAIDHKKYKTKIGKNVFVGSDTQFVAPVEIGDGAIIGSGSTITKNVPANALAVARGRQIIKENFAAQKVPTKKE